MSADSVLEAAGELRRAYEGVDWSATCVGPPESWDATLRNAVELALHTRFPVTLFYGRDGVLVYNEAYAELIGDKHPSALGAPARAVFPEAWETIGPLIAGVKSGHGAIWLEDAPVPLQRHGFLQEAYFTFSYSPVTAPDGTVEGVLDIATETTRQVIDRRRLELLSRLRELLAGVETFDELRERGLSLLREYVDDLPRVDILSVGEAESIDGETPVRSEASVVAISGGSGRVARFRLGSAERGDRPHLAVELSDRLAPDATYLGFLGLMASSLGQALDRINTRAAERVSANAERNVAEALQRSLLTEPPQPTGLEIAVRYQASAERARLGGDWHDAFVGPDGTLNLVIGDVTGHDHRAVAAMAQVRNLLRGVCVAGDGSPSAILTALDRAMQVLGVDMYATAVFARAESGRAAGGRRLRWSNAGHPPPVLIAADGRARLLETHPDPLLGLGEGMHSEHTATIEPGASFVLYTDGLVERRSVPLQRRLEWLVAQLDGMAGASAQEICDHLLAQLDDGVHDDVALLVMRSTG